MPTSLAVREKIRYGIAGFGNFAERAIAPAIRSSPNSTLVALQKRSLAAARAKSSEFGIPLAFDSVGSMVRHPDIDAVFIVSANALHCPETVAAADAGKHVLVEKPMALNAREAERMVDACRNNRVKLMVGHMVRLSPVVTRMKSLIRAGQLGTIVGVRSEFVYDARSSQRSWAFDRTLAGGGPVFDVGVHCLDTIRYLLDDEVIEVHAALDPPPTPKRTESTAQLGLRFSRGTVAGIFCSFTAPVRRSILEVMGTEGVLYAEDFTRSDLAVSLTMTGRAGGSVSRTEEIVVPNLYEHEVTLFSESILKDSEPPIPGEEGLKNQLVLDAALSGRPQVAS